MPRKAGPGVWVAQGTVLRAYLSPEPTPQLAAASIYPGTDGGALFCSQFYVPTVGDNSLGVATTSITITQQTSS